jgi:hypothetical protein
LERERYLGVAIHYITGRGLMLKSSTDSLYRPEAIVVDDGFRLFPASVKGSMIGCVKTNHLGPSIKAGAEGSS